LHTIAIALLHIAIKRKHYILLHKEKKEEKKKFWLLFGLYSLEISPFCLG
jgi:hypothetical protein